MIDGIWDIGLRQLACQFVLIALTVNIVALSKPVSREINDFTISVDPFHIWFQMVHLSVVHLWNN